MQKLLFSALLLSALAASSLAQDAKPAGDVKPAVQKTGVTSRASRPKLARTQGSSQYSEIRCGLQDRAGTLWFGTTGEGVYSYDGKGFTQYTVGDGLGSNTV
jgi:hypothetical protein